MQNTRCLVLRLLCAFRNAVTCIGKDMLPFFLGRCMHVYFACIGFAFWGILHACTRLCAVWHAAYTACLCLLACCIYDVLHALLMHFWACFMHARGRQNRYCVCSHFARILQDFWSILGKDCACKMRSVLLCAFCVHFGMPFCSDFLCVHRLGHVALLLGTLYACVFCMHGFMRFGSILHACSRLCAVWHADLSRFVTKGMESTCSIVLCLLCAFWHAVLFGFSCMPWAGHVAFPFGMLSAYMSCMHWLRISGHTSCMCKACKLRCCACFHFA